MPAPPPRVTLPAMSTTLRGGFRWHLRRAPSAATVPGVGTIVAMINTERGPVDRPLVHFVLRVALEGCEPYDATAAAAVPVDVLRFLRPGASVSLQVDPDDPTAPVVDLSRLWITPAVAFA